MVGYSELLIVIVHTIPYSPMWNYSLYLHILWLCLIKPIKLFMWNYSITKKVKKPNKQCKFHFICWFCTRTGNRRAKLFFCQMTTTQWSPLHMGCGDLSATCEVGSPKFRFIRRASRQGLIQACVWFPHHTASNSLVQIVVECIGRSSQWLESWIEINHSYAGMIH